MRGNYCASVADQVKNIVSKKTNLKSTLYLLYSLCWCTDWCMHCAQFAQWYTFVVLTSRARALMQLCLCSCLPLCAICVSLFSDSFFPFVLDGYAFNISVQFKIWNSLNFKYICSFFFSYSTLNILFIAVKFGRIFSNILSSCAMYSSVNRSKAIAYHEHRF